RDLEAVLLDDLEEVSDPRVVGDARAHEADARLAALRQLGHGLAEGVEAPVPHRPVHLALEAEAAAAAAALADLEEGHAAVLRARRLDRRDRLEGIHVLEAPLGDDRGCAGARRDGGEPAAGRPGHGVALRDVDALDRGERVEQRLAVAVTLAIALDQLDDELLALADGDH